MKFMIASVLLMSSFAHAIISEEIDDLESFSCQGANFQVDYDGHSVKGTGTDLKGRRLDLSGKLNSAAIDTEENSITYTVFLLNSEVTGIRYMTLTWRKAEGATTLDLHANITKVLGSLGKGTCSVHWKR